MSEANAIVSIGPKNQCSDVEPGKKFQGVNVHIPECVTRIWIDQNTWDKLSDDKKQDALALISGGWYSFMCEWEIDSVDTVDILAGVKPIEGKENGDVGTGQPKEGCSNQEEVQDKQSQEGGSGEKGTNAANSKVG